MSANTTLSPQKLRETLISFWDESLEIEPTPTGLLFTMPFSYPDGWQVVLELSQQTPKGYYLSDRGKTLSWLQGQGQNISTDAMSTHLKKLCSEHSITLQNGVLHRWLEAPVEAIDVQVFAEGVTAISRLELLHDHRIPEENIADTLVQRVLRDAGLEPKAKHRLSITKERKISVDYYIERQKPLAIQLLRTKNDVSGTMEKWGFRWHELRKAYQDLSPVMFYNRDTQIIDPYSRHIGETECDLFCGYDETDRIHEFLLSQ
ncbi:MAG: DUF1828 domain-containing protein [Akkermansiaceae bacterium]